MEERGEANRQILLLSSYFRQSAVGNTQHTVIRSCHRSRVVLMLSVCRIALQSCLFER